MKPESQDKIGLQYAAETEVEEVVVKKKTTASKKGNEARIIVYNDDHNSFDWVIQCFVEVLGHEFAQAEQLSLIIHFKGKACVKKGSKKKLKPLKDALVERGLSAVITTEGEDG
ncbi:MAG: ATP-dependent Clp protease adaptor ClpS [Saprospiraceae bacterium]|jgi:ATP-dependent Clp protease adaptor protein ClpS